MKKVAFSIIIATYNSEHCLQNCLNSIRNQTFDDFELIVIDGGSKDTTIDIIKRNTDVINQWVSEPDNGIYDAWNKGIKLSNGNWILFVGSDDILLPHALNEFNFFIERNKDEEIEYISARVLVLDQTSKPIRKLGSQWNWRTFKKYMNVAHVGSLHSRKLFEKYGYFDSSYKITGDYEFLLRANSNLKAAFMDSVIAHMQTGGVSTNPTKAFKEARRAKHYTGRRNKVSVFIDDVIARMKYSVRQVIGKIR